MSRAGNSYTDLAVAFVEVFPIDTKLSVKEFDKWGMEQGEISQIPYDDTPVNSPEWSRLVIERNNLRKKVNLGATSEKFLEMAEKEFYHPFSVDVWTHGEEYFVQSALDSYEALSTRLPATVYRLAVTKRQRICQLRTSIDYAKLPPAQQLIVKQLDKYIRALMKGFQRNLEDFNKEYANVMEEIGKLNLAPRNGRAISFDPNSGD